jgi:hypothetical protein
MAFGDTGFGEGGHLTYGDGLDAFGDFSLAGSHGSSPYGVALPGWLAWINPTASGTSAADLGNAATKQVGYALAGKWLATPQLAEDYKFMATASANNAGAYLHCGYWMAVAARVGQNRTLAASAGKYVAQGVATANLPGASLMTGSVASIYKSASLEVAKAASVASFTAKPFVLQISKQLQAWADPAAIRARQDQTGDEKTIDPQLPIRAVTDAYEAGGSAFTAGQIALGVVAVGVLGGLGYLIYTQYRK